MRLAYSIHYVPNHLIEILEVTFISFISNGSRYGGENEDECIPHYSITSKQQRKQTYIYCTMAPPVAAARASPRSPRSPPSRTASSRSTAMALAVKGAVPPLPLSKDPAALLDSLDNKRAAASGSTATSEPFDPVDFLNQHYETEQSLSQQLPALREAVGGRMELLNDRISNALQRQSETAESTRRHVETAKASVQALEHRILQVKEKAAGSEKAVLEITADMKRLDCAKRHLQRTITTLKNLHMLVHAVEQLRNTVHSRDYKTASHLVDAVTQLLQHFEAYTARVHEMRVLSNKVSEYQTQLRKSVVTGFRVAAFGQEKAMELEGNTNLSEEETLPVLSAEDMQGGVLLIDSLGETCRIQFIHEFCQDCLGDY